MCNVSYGFSLNATQSKSGNGSGFKTQLSDLSKRAPKIKNRYPVQDAFHFTVDCGELGVTNCAQAKILLRNAGIKIASQILIKTPITVMAAFMPFLSQHFAVANPINVGNRF